ncbi:MAG: hypothetical protein ACRC62_24820 [Microcoleus sp.]
MKTRFDDRVILEPWDLRHLIAHYSAIVDQALPECQVLVRWKIREWEKALEAFRCTGYV